MTFSQYVGGPAVSERLPVVARAITYAARDAAETVHTSIGVPYAVCTQVRVFMPPGVNYSIKLQVGFNGKRMIPTANATDYIMGSGVVHTFPWNIPVQSAVDVWALCDNANPHTVWVAFDLDLNPIIRAADLRPGPKVTL